MSLHKLLIKAAETGVPVETLIDRKWEEHHHNVAAMARDLGCSRQAIYLRLAKRRDGDRAAVGK